MGVSMSDSYLYPQILHQEKLYLYLSRYGQYITHTYRLSTHGYRLTHGYIHTPWEGSIPMLHVTLAPFSSSLPLLPVPAAVASTHPLMQPDKIGGPPLQKGQGHTR